MLSVHAERTKSRKRKENKNSEKGRERRGRERKIKRTNRIDDRGREPERHEVSRYLRQEIERKDKWWKNSERASGKMQESACRWQIRKSRQELSYRH